MKSITQEIAGDEQTQIRERVAREKSSPEESADRKREEDERYPF